MSMSPHQWSYGSHSHSITTTPTITTHWVHNIDPDYTTKKEAPVSAADKIRDERREKKERLRVEALWEGYDVNNFEDAEEGTVIAFRWSPKDNDKTYDYVAIYTSGGWYCTGDLAPRHADHDTFVAWLIDKNVAISDIEFLRGG